MTTLTDTRSNDVSENGADQDKQHQLRWLALIVLGLGLFIGVVDSSVVNVATPAMKEEFGATDSQMLMLITIYSLVFASFLLLFGKVGSKYGLRRLQITGAGLFGLSSLLIGLAPSIEFVNGMRVFAGLAAAMGGASGMALVHCIFKGRDRAVAFGVWGATASLGAAVGPVLGGLAVTYVSWRTAFFINIPISLLIIIGCYLWVTEVKHEHPGSIDFVGAAVIGLGLFAVILAFIYGPTWGWWSAKTSFSISGVSPVPWLLVVGILLILIFFPYWLSRREVLGKEPIFDLGLFKLHSFRGGMLASFSRQIAQFAPIYALAIFLEETAGWTASETGQVFVVSAIGGVIAGPLSGKFANRWGAKPVVIGGKIVMAISILWLLAVIDTNVSSAMLVGPMFLFGLSIGLAASQLNTVVMADVSLAKAGDASAAKSAIARVGNSFGAAFVGILLVISINDVLIMALIFVFIALALAFTLPNVKVGE